MDSLAARIAAGDIARRVEILTADGHVSLLDALHVALEEIWHGERGLVHLAKLPVYSRLLGPGEPCPRQCIRCLEVGFNRPIGPPPAAMIAAGQEYGWTPVGECQGCMMIYIRVPEGKAVVQYG